MIEDEEMVAKVASSMIEHLGYQSILALTGQDALIQLRENADFVLIILDYNLPDISASDCVREIRRFTQAPVLISSGFGKTLPKEGDQPLTVDGFLPKPFTLATVKQAIEQYVKS